MGVQTTARAMHSRRGPSVAYATRAGPATIAPPLYAPMDVCMVPVRFLTPAYVILDGLARSVLPVRLDGAPQARIAMWPCVQDVSMAAAISLENATATPATMGLTAINRIMLILARPKALVRAASPTLLRLVVLQMARLELIVLLDTMLLQPLHVPTYVDTMPIFAARSAAMVGLEAIA